MSLLKSLNDGHGVLKAGFLGFQKAGKTFTAVELAIGTRAHFGLKGPIAFFDTETGSTYIAERVKQATGKDLMGHCGRALTDLIALTHECKAAGVSVLIVDSVTHVWREVIDSYQKQTKRKELSFRDWGPIKSKWYEWTDLYLNSPVHTIICGRAGWEYDFEENDRGKKELVKTGTKLKAEAEFGFEPSLLVEMELLPSGKRLATVRGDRFNVIDGLECENPTFDFFRPHLEKLKPGAHATVDLAQKTEFDVDSENWPAEKRQREILCEEIQGELVKRWPGQTAAEKAAKLEVIERMLGTRSWTKVESTPSAQLRDALDRIRVEFGPRQQELDDTLPAWAEDK
jgi:hypothetical protein